MNDSGTGARIGFAPEVTVLGITDLLEREELLLEADREVELSPALTDLFPFPVDRAVSFDAGRIRFPAHSVVGLRDGEGEFVESMLEPTEYGAGTYLFDVTANVRTYVRVEDAAFSASGRNEDDSFVAEFEEPTRVTVGSRSLHTRPEATILVPDEPTAAMEAVSHLGSSIKEFSAERSWPTLRGHPPRLRRGERLAVPDWIDRPQTGVRIAVPPEYPDLYRVAPLAFYLGATVEPGDRAELRLENGYAESLSTAERSLAETVEDLLKRCLLLDSLVRTEGYIPSKRYEYRELGPELPFYPPNLSDASLSAQLMEYLEVKRSVLEPYYPDWSPTAVLRPGPADVELLPYLAHGLSPVRVSEESGGATRPEKTVPYGYADGLAPAASSGGTPPATPETLPPSAALLSVEPYETAFDRPPAAPGEAAVALVADSPERKRRWDEGLDGLADGDVAVGEVETVARPDCERFRRLFDGEYDLVYVGLEGDRDEVSCADGAVRLAELGGAKPRIAVFESGPSVAGVAPAVRGGGVAGAVVDRRVPVDRLREFLEALSVGLPLAASARLTAVDGGGTARYVGDPGSQLAHAPNRTPTHVVEVEPIEPDRYALTTHTEIAAANRLGGEHGILRDWADDRNHLAGTSRDDHRPLTAAELLEEGNLEDMAIRTPDGLAVAPGSFTEDDVSRLVRQSRWSRSDGGRTEI
ncbi:MAG: hypothetical protein V5A46_11395 [Haloferacaceae archaeon]